MSNVVIVTGLPPRTPLATVSAALQQVGKVVWLRPFYALRRGYGARYVLVQFDDFGAVCRACAPNAQLCLGTNRIYVQNFVETVSAIYFHSCYVLLASFLESTLRWNDQITVMFFYPTGVLSVHN